MKKTIIFIAGLIILAVLIRIFLFTGSDQDSGVDFEYETYGNRFFEDRSAGYQLYYPADWSLEDHSFKDELIRADIHLGDTAGIQVRKMEYDGRDQEAYVRAYLNNFRSDMEEHWQGWSDGVEISEDSSGKESCWKLSLDFKTEDQEWYFRHYLWFRSDRVIVFQGGIIKHYQDIYEPVFTEIARSLEFTY